MRSLSGLRRQVLGLLAVTLAALGFTVLAAAPAQAAYGPPQLVDIQLQGISATGGVTPVGRMVGSIRFDDGNSMYQLDVVVCRQSSLVDQVIRTEVNGAPHRAISPFNEGRSDTPRPEFCPEFAYVAVIIDLPYSGVVQKVKVNFEGVYFDGATSTASRIIRSRTYDNPFN